MGIALLGTALLASSAVATSSAMAEGRPEYKKCVLAPKNAVTKRYEGEYDGKLCSNEPTKTEIESAEKTGKKYDLVEIVEGEKGTVVASATSINADGILVTCKKGTGTVEVLSQFEGAEKLTLKECSHKVGTVAEPCGTSGTIQTNEIHNGLFFINEAETEKGIAFLPEGGVLTEYSCGATKVVVEGTAVIGTVTNSSKGVAVAFATNTKKEQLHKFAWFFATPIGPLSLESGGKEATLKAKLTQGPPLVHAYF
jgi:hypothetical protein